MKTLEQWTKEIDEWIARWLADFEAGRYYECNDEFYESIINEVKEERKMSGKKDCFIFNKKEEWILV